MFNMNFHRKHTIVSAVALCETFKLLLFSKINLSDSDDDGDEGQVNLFTLIKKYQCKNGRNEVIRIKNYCEDIVPRFSSKQFQQNFRMSKESFEVIVGYIGPLLKNNHRTGRPSIDVRKQLLAVIWLMATPDSYRSVGERFDLGKSSLSDCFFRVVKALNKIAPHIIKWPRGEKATEIIHSFSSRGLRGVLGVVDGTYIPIKAPKENSQVYITRKCNYAMTLQGICDNNLYFIDAYIAFPGSVSDTRIFRNSTLFKEVVNNPAEFFPNNSFLLGDKAYPLKIWCIPPYIERRPLTDMQRNFNTIHAKERTAIERTWALFFGRIRRMRYLDMNRVDWIPATVIAACVIHNICKQHENDLEEYIREGEGFIREQVNEVGDNGNILHEADHNDHEAVEKRNLLALNLFQNI